MTEPYFVPLAAFRGAVQRQDWSAVAGMIGRHLPGAVQKHGPLIVWLAHYKWQGTETPELMAKAWELEPPPPLMDLTEFRHAIATQDWQVAAHYVAAQTQTDPDPRELAAWLSTWHWLGQETHISMAHIWDHLHAPPPDDPWQEIADELQTLGQSITRLGTLLSSILKPAFDDLMVQVRAMHAELWNAYRDAGMPYGPTEEGLRAWVRGAHPPESRAERARHGRELLARIRQEPT
jgi:hypothetical protein